MRSGTALPPPDNGANKPVAPASILQVGGAGPVVGKKSLEVWERLWEPKIATPVNVHEHGRTLPLVAVGDNRIGKDRSKDPYDLCYALAPRFKKRVRAILPGAPRYEDFG